MRITRSSLVSVLVAAAFVGVAGRAAAGPLAPSKPSDVIAVAFVTEGNNAVPCNGLAGAFAPSWISKANGSIGPYSVPPKSVFVVTSLNFVATGRTPSRIASVQFTIVDGANPPIDAPSFTLGSSLADAGGTVAGQTVFPTGFVIKPPALPCISFGGAGNAILHGFFAKDK